MKQFVIIALLELQRMKRNQIIWFLCLLSAFLLILFDRFHYFTIEEQIKMIKDFSLGLMNLSMLILVVYYPICLIKDELSERTIYSLLSTPITRNTIILGKALAMALVLFIALFLNSLALSAMLILKGATLSPQLVIALLMIYLKNLTLVSFAVLFSVLPLSRIIGTIMTLFVYCLGSIKSYFLETLERDLPLYLQYFQKCVFSLVPNFRIYDVVENITLGRTVTLTHLLFASVHFIGIAVLIYGISFFIFNRKEL